MLRTIRQPYGSRTGWDWWLSKNEIFPFQASTHGEHVDPKRFSSLRLGKEPFLYVSRSTSGALHEREGRVGWGVFLCLRNTLRSSFENSSQASGSHCLPRFPEVRGSFLQSKKKATCHNRAQEVAGSHFYT